MSQVSAELLAALRDVVGDGHLLADPELRAGFERDWTGRFGGEALAVVRPADRDEVAAVLRICAEHGAAVVPQGGNTGLVGGGVPRGGEIVLSTTRLTGIGELDPASGQISAGAGVTLAALQAACAAAGADAGLDFGARDGATLGGIAACDAGGIKALRHGTARRRIVGIEAVLADGNVIERMAGLLKDNAGYDLPALLVGSEGTLGVITAVRWQSVVPGTQRVAAIVPVDTVDGAIELLAALRRGLPSLEACDFVDATCLELSCAHLGRSLPLAQAPPLAIFLECVADSDPTEALATVLDDLGHADNAVLATDTASRRSLWELRESVPEAIATTGVAHHIDIGIPLARLAAFIDALPGALIGHGETRSYCFGHLGDGNVHVSLVGPASADHGVDDAALALALSLGGTISAEHGVGTAKAAWLERCRGTGQVAAMRAIKDALDPRSMMNPGVVLTR